MTKMLVREPVQACCWMLSLASFRTYGPETVQIQKDNNFVFYKNVWGSEKSQAEGRFIRPDQ